MQGSEGKIVVFGSIVQDLISYTSHFPRPGESVRGTSFLAVGGGKGANQAVAAARLGANVTLIGRVGEDVFGDQNIDCLRRNGVNVDNVEKSATSTTATATITVNEEGENSIVVTLGANFEMDEKAAERHESEIVGAGLVLAQAEICPKGNRRIFELARKYGVATFFNPAPGDRSLDKSILGLVDVICTNENEAEFITNIPQLSLEDAKKAASQMLEMGPKHVIITLGAKGCVLASKGEEIQHIGVEEVSAIDTTGAGDCFCGSLSVFILHGMPMPSAVQRAAAISTLSVQRKGAQSSYWTREEIAKYNAHLLE